MNSDPLATAASKIVSNNADVHPIRCITRAIVGPGGYHRAVITDEELVTALAATTDRPGPTAMQTQPEQPRQGSPGAGVVHFKLICPSASEVWDTPANAGFERAAIVARLGALRAGGHDYELVDGDALSDQQRSDLYGQAFSALARAGNRYRIRQVFGSDRHGGGDHLGSGVAALLVFEDGEPVDVYPHQVGDSYETIRAYLDAL